MIAAPLLGHPKDATKTYGRTEEVWGRDQEKYPSRLMRRNRPLEVGKGATKGTWEIGPVLNRGKRRTRSNISNKRGDYRRWSC